MGLFDSLKNQARGAVREAVQGVGNKTEAIVFPTVPDSFEAFTALPQAAMSTPFETAAMTVIALCVYPHAPQTSVQMLNSALSGTGSVPRITCPVPISAAPRPRTTTPRSRLIPSGSWRTTTASLRKGLPSCSSPPGARTIPGPSSCGRPRTGSGICGSRPFSPISGSRKAPTPGSERGRGPLFSLRIFPRCP